MNLSLKKQDIPDDGRDLVPELADAIATLSHGNPALIVLSGQVVAKLPRQAQLRFLSGDMSALTA